jgi:hypothetical protein
MRVFDALGRLAPERLDARGSRLVAKQAFEPFIHESLERIRFKLNRTLSRTICFDALSLREPVSPRLKRHLGNWPAVVIMTASFSR